MNTSNASPARHPAGLKTLFFTEMWERFSYYGMRAILVLAMVAAAESGGMGLDDTTATAIYGLYTAAVYLLALPGGWIADRLIGARSAVWYGGLFIAAGHFTMAVPTLQTFYVGMLLIAIGTGLLKPNISTLVGDLYASSADISGARRDAGFSIFYMGINIGALLGQIICGYLGERVGWHYGFGAAGAFMVLGLVFYRSGSARLGDAGLRPVMPDAERRRNGAIVAAAVVIATALVGAVLAGFWVLQPLALAQNTVSVIVGGAMAFFFYVIVFGGLTSPEKKHVGVIAVFFVAAAIFWSGFEQAGSSFNLFAERYTDRMIFGWEMPASWLQGTNSVFIILFAPVLAALWVHLAARNLNPSTPLKFALGLMQLALGFAVLWWASFEVIAGNKVAPTWLILTYLFHTTGELCLSPVGLSAVTKLAPKRYASQMMGTWFMGAALGNLLGGLIAGHFGKDALAEMPERLMTIVMITGAAGVLLALCAKPLRHWTKGVE